MATVRNIVYAVVGLIGLFILVVAVVCISVHIYHCCSRHRRKRSDAGGDSCSRPSASSTAVDCQYVTLQMNDGPSSSAAAAAAAAVPTAPASSCESVELQPVGRPESKEPNAKPPSYDEVMGYRWDVDVNGIKDCTFLVGSLVCISSAWKSCCSYREIVTELRRIYAICWCCTRTSTLSGVIAYMKSVLCAVLSYLASLCVAQGLKWLRQNHSPHKYISHSAHCVLVGTFFDIYCQRFWVISVDGLVLFWSCVFLAHSVHQSDIHDSESNVTVHQAAFLVFC